MARVFVSYRHEAADARVAGRLAEALARLGHEVFIDRQIPAGIEFDEHIGARLRQCDVFVFLVSRAAHQSKWVRAELRMADGLATTAGRPRIIPFVLESFADEWRMEWRVILDPLNHVACLDVDRDWDAAVAKVAAELTPSVESSRSEPARRTFDRDLVRLGISPVAWRRSAVVDEAARRIREPGAPVVLLGLAGIGKTTVLHQAATQVQGEFEHALAVPLGQAEGPEPAFVLEELNGFLAAQGRGLDPERLQRQTETRSLADMAGALAGSGTLVLLDALERAPAAWAESVLRTLGATPGVRLLASARVRVDRCPTQEVAVPVLSAGEALAFVAHQAHALDVDVAPAQLLARLPESIRAHPQALATVIGLLRDVPLDDLLDWGLPDDARAPLAVVTGAVAALDPASRRALALLVALREVELKSALDVLRMTPPAGFMTALSDLRARALVHRADRGYTVPAIVRDALAAADPPAFQGALETAVAAFTRADTGGASIGVLAAVGGTLASAASDCTRWDLVAAVTGEDRLEAFNRAGQWTAYSLLLRLGADAARERDDQRARLRLSFRLARKRFQVGDRAGARAVLEGIAGQTGPADTTLERAEYLSHRALFQEEDGDVEGALAGLAESARLREALGDTDGLAVVLKLAGHIHLRRRDPARARGAYEAALELLPSGPSKEGVDLAWGLATCALAEGRAEDAERRCRDALAACDALAYEAGRPRLMVALARALERQGRLADARGLAQAALAKAEAFDPAATATARALLRVLEAGRPGTPRTKG
jgi:tetratricopeptide (TPR) repeat protein